MAPATFTGDHQVIITGGTGIITPEDFKAYWEEIMSAFAIHLSKENIRQALWKNYPARDQVNQIKIKGDRVWRSLETIPEVGQARRELFIGNMQEELYDIINYANFALRQLGA